jgi:predicted enzyme related to lactoylglutathione lyase
MSETYNHAPGPGSYDGDMKKLTVFKIFVHDHDAALRFYVDELGFVVAEDRRLGDYRWLVIRAPGDAQVGLALELARTDEERALVGRQAARQPLFGLATDDCLRDYGVLRARGVRFDGEPRVMPYGTGVMLQDLYGNRIYLNQEPGGGVPA